ncbi:MAG: hypothetical protein JWQ77_2351 [Jatrophihabitans sp.]|nr:hypothetical protein [Jatrophihabitans sp.]
MHLPSWLWGGDVPALFSAAHLIVVTPPSQGRGLVVEAVERTHPKEKPKLVVSRELAGPGIDQPVFDLLTELDSPAYEQIQAGGDRHEPELQRHLAGLRERAEHSPPLSAISATFAAHQLVTMTSSASELPLAARTAWNEIRQIELAESTSPAYPDASVHFVQRAEAILHRTKLAAVLLRLEHDDRLRSGDLTAVQAALANGQEVFAAGGALGEGFALLDAYLAPLLGAMTPFVWAFPATRASGTVLYALGKQIRGTEPVAAEPLHLLPARSADRASSAPTVAAGASGAAITWWTRRLDKIMSVISDPAIYSDAMGQYSPSKHLHAQLSLDQLFRRVGSIQRAHRDTDARRVLLFTVLDTLERLTNRSLVEMCTLRFAERTLTKLRALMPADAASLLLPAAERAVDAIKQLQDGFFVARQAGASVVAFRNNVGEARPLSFESAAAEYVRVLRNATHGHGSNRKDHKPLVDALLAHHSGQLPHDLGLLGWLYLLDVMASPESLRRTLWASGAD